MTTRYIIAPMLVVLKIDTDPNVHAAHVVFSRMSDLVDEKKIVDWSVRMRGVTSRGTADEVCYAWVIVYNPDCPDGQRALRKCPHIVWW